jgi:ATP synthase complex subunit h
MQLRRPPAKVAQSPSSLSSRPPLIPFLTDLIQDLYLKELRTYKAPPVVSQPSVHFRSLPLTPVETGQGCPCGRCEGLLRSSSALCTRAS